MARFIDKMFNIIKNEHKKGLVYVCYHLFGWLIADCIQKIYENAAGSGRQLTIIQIDNYDNHKMHCRIKICSNATENYEVFFIQSAIGNNIMRFIFFYDLNLIFLYVMVVHARSVTHSFTLMHALQLSIERTDFHCEKQYQFDV